MDIVGGDFNFWLFGKVCVGVVLLYHYYQLILFYHFILLYTL